MFYFYKKIICSLSNAGFGIDNLQKLFVKLALFDFPNEMSSGSTESKDFLLQSTQSLDDLFNSSDPNPVSEALLEKRNMHIAQLKALEEEKEKKVKGLFEKVKNYKKKVYKKIHSKNEAWPVYNHDIEQIADLPIIQVKNSSEEIEDVGIETKKFFKYIDLLNIGKGFVSIRGVAGAGKTTGMIRLLHETVDEKSAFYKNSTALYIEAGEMYSKGLNDNEFLKYINNELQSDYKNLAECFKEFAEANHNLFFLVDGVDETKSEQVLNFLQQLFSSEESYRPVVIVSHRETVILDEKLYATFQVQGLSLKDIKKICELKNLDDAFNYFKKNDLLEICENPLLLNILLTIYKNNIKKENSQTHSSEESYRVLSNIFKAIVNNVYQSEYSSVKSKKEAEKRLTLADVDWAEITRYYQNVANYLFEKDTYEGFQEKALAFDKQDLEKFKSSIMHIDQKTHVPRFMHRLFAEYFVAQTMQLNVEELIKASKNLKDKQAFLNKFRAFFLLYAEDKYKLCFKLLAGLLKAADINSFIELFNLQKNTSSELIFNLPEEFYAELFRKYYNNKPAAGNKYLDTVSASVEKAILLKFKITLKTLMSYLTDEQKIYLFPQVLKHEFKNENMPDYLDQEYLVRHGDMSDSLAELLEFKTLSEDNCQLYIAYIQQLAEPQKSIECSALCSIAAELFLDPDFYSVENVRFLNSKFNELFNKIIAGDKALKSKFLEALPSQLKIRKNREYVYKGNDDVILVHALEKFVLEKNEYQDPDIIISIFPCLSKDKQMELSRQISNTLLAEAGFATRLIAAGVFTDDELIKHTGYNRWIKIERELDSIKVHSFQNIYLVNLENIIKEEKTTLKSISTFEEMEVHFKVFKKIFHTFKELGHFHVFLGENLEKYWNVFCQLSELLDSQAKIMLNKKPGWQEQYRAVNQVVSYRSSSYFDDYILRKISLLNAISDQYTSVVEEKYRAVHNQTVKKMYSEYFESLFISEENTFFSWKEAKIIANDNIFYFNPEMLETKTVIKCAAKFQPEDVFDVLDQSNPDSYKVVEAIVKKVWEDNCVSTNPEITFRQYLNLLTLLREKFKPSYGRSYIRALKSLDKLMPVLKYEKRAELFSSVYACWALAAEISLNKKPYRYPFLPLEAKLLKDFIKYLNAFIKKELDKFKFDELISYKKNGGYFVEKIGKAGRLSKIMYEKYLKIFGDIEKITNIKKQWQSMLHYAQTVFSVYQALVVFQPLYKKTETEYPENFSSINEIKNMTNQISGYFNEVKISMKRKLKDVRQLKLYLDQSAFALSGLIRQASEKQIVASFGKETKRIYALLRKAGSFKEEGSFRKLYLSMAEKSTPLSIENFHSCEKNREDTNSIKEKIISYYFENSEEYELIKNTFVKIEKPSSEFAKKRTEFTAVVKNNIEQQEAAKNSLLEKIKNGQSFNAAEIEKYLEI